MAAKKRALGRGLDSLLTGKDTGKSADKVTDKDAPVQNLTIDGLQRGPYQPRQFFDDQALDDLAQSIRKQGVIQPIVVRPLPSGGHEIIAGERRWKAAQRAGLKKIPAVIRQVDDASTMAIALIENLQREDLGPLEEASGLARLIEEFNLTQQKAADALGKSRPQVANLLRLLSLNHLVKDMLHQNQIEMGHARALLALDDVDQTRIARIVAQQNLSVRATEDLVKKTLNPPAKTPTTAKPADPNITALQNDLEQTLGAKVSLKHNPNGKGSLHIQYNSLDELDGILEHIK